jgi:hypothetical protein
LCINTASAQSVVGKFKAIKAEKIGGNFYVIGVEDRSLIKIVKYDENLKLVKEIARPVKEIGSMFGYDYVSVFTDRNIFDIRIVYSSKIVAWLSFDLNLNELSLTEHEYVKNKKEASQPNLYNPVYSQGSYASNFGFQKTMPGFYIKNKFYHFLIYKGSEFSNTSNEKFIYSKDPSPVFRKLETADGSPFYNEISRVDLSNNEVLKDLDFKKYRINLAGTENGSVYFLATKKTKSPIKDDVKLMKVSEKNLQFDKTVDLNLDSIIPELGSTFFTTTVMDEARQRVIQIGNYTGSPYDRKWWHNELDNLKREYLKIKGFYICEFDMRGTIKKIKTFPLPDNGSPANDEQYRALVCQANGIVFSGDGTINMVAENCILLKTVSKGPKTSHTSYTEYAPVGVTFLSVDSTLQKIQSESVAFKDMGKVMPASIYNNLIEFNAQPFVNYSTALLTPKIVDNKKVYYVYSAFRGMSVIEVVPNEVVMLYDKDSCVIFKPANENGVYELNIESNH